MKMKALYHPVFPIKRSQNESEWLRGVEMGQCQSCDPGLVLVEGLCLDSKSNQTKDTFIKQCDPAFPTLTPDTRCNGHSYLCSKTLSEIYIPGTHNSGSYRLRLLNSGGTFGIGTVLGDPDNTNSICQSQTGLANTWSLYETIARASSTNQNRSIIQQLNDGIRFLDIDVCEYPGLPGNVFTCHCIWGRRLERILNSVRKWLLVNKNEVLVIRFQDGLQSKTKGALAQRVGAHLEHFLSSMMIPKHSKTKTLSELIRCNERVLILWDSIHQASKWWAITNFSTGSYANTNKPAVMMQDQLTKAKLNKPSKIHLVSWILSPTKEDIIKNIGHTWLIDRYAKQVNGQLAKVASELGPSVIMTDFFQTSPPTVINIANDLNRKLFKNVSTS